MNKDISGIVQEMWNENRTQFCTPDQKSDFGCAVCMKTSIYERRMTKVKMQSCTQSQSVRQYCSKRCFKKDWEDLTVLAQKTNRTRSKMIGRLIRFFKDNKGSNGKTNGKNKNNL